MKLRSISRCGLTIAETLIAATTGSAVMAALTFAAISLNRSFVATESYAIAQSDQMRISDYFSMDLRSAIAEPVIVNDADGNLLSLTILLPDFFDNDGNPRNPTLSGGLITYGAGTVQVQYTVAGDTVNRTVTRGGTTTTLPVARGVEEFKIQFLPEISGAYILNNVLTTQITFTPRFRFYDPSNQQGQAASAVYGRTYLRNMTPAAP